MTDNVYKILFIGISGKNEHRLKTRFHNACYVYQFCIIEEIELTIESYKPDLLITSLPENISLCTKNINTVKTLSERFTIPFIVLINSSVEDNYLFLIKNSVSSFITLPLGSAAFFNQINKILDSRNSNTPIDAVVNNPAKESCSTSEKALITNLVIQNKTLKGYLKKSKPSEEIKKIHRMRIEETRATEKKLWDALENGYFRLYYQPVISLDSDKLSGFESLIRIDHPTEGILPPSKFIDTAEKSAIIFPLGLWIVEEACRQIVFWNEKYNISTPLRININLSAKQFIHPELADHIFEITEKYGVDENNIAFEITESAFMEDMESANMTLLKLRSKKFFIYMDDFGTGYSSLSYLMHFPVNVIKIDQSFVEWMHIDEQSEIIVKSIIMLAHNLGLKVVAEGTEDISQIEKLKNLGCDYAQGYYYSKPLPDNEAGIFISNHFEMKK